MASGHSDPKLLYAVEGVHAYQIINGHEESLTPSGPQTLSLLMVPTSSGFADASAGGSTGGNESSAEDFYIHLHLPPDLDLPMPATTQIYHQPPNSYLIPRWDLGPDSGAFTRIEFPRVGSRPNVQEDVDTFETILAQCTAFLERAAAPSSTTTTSSKKAPSPADAKAKEAGFYNEPPAYNPANYKAGEAYAQGSKSAQQGGRIVLVDEEDGSVIGELGEGFQVIEDSAIKPGTKDPVIVSLPQDGSQAIKIGPAPHEYVGKDMHPAYRKSTLVSKATEASQLFVTTSDFITRKMAAGADSFTEKTQPVKPVTFNPSTHQRVRRINTFSTKAAGLSASTIGSISKHAQNFGAGIGKKKGGGARGFDAQGNVIESYKPGVLNKSLMAFNTVVDGFEQASRSLLAGSATSMTTVVGHRWGPEAGEVASHLSGGVKNVGLVYIDVTGVSRRAIIKSVAKGMVVGQVKGGGQVIVGGNGSSVATGGASTLGASGNGKEAVSSMYGDSASIASSRPLLDKKPSKGPY